MRHSATRRTAGRSGCRSGSPRGVEAPHGRAEVRSAGETPARDFAIVGVLAAVGGHLDVPAGAPGTAPPEQRPTPDPLAGDGIGAGRRLGDGVCRRPADLVEGVDGGGDVGNADRRRCLIRPDVALYLRPSSGSAMAGPARAARTNANTQTAKSLRVMKGPPFRWGADRLRLRIGTDCFTALGARLRSKVTPSRRRPAKASSLRDLCYDRATRGTL